MKLAFSLILCIGMSLTSIDAHAGIDINITKEPSQKQDLRIKKLLPINIPSPLNIEPAIPANFVALSPSGKLDINEWTFWGPEDVVNIYLKNAHDLSKPIIGLKIGTITQKEIENPNRAEFIKNLANLGVSNFRDVSVRWGNYPVYAVAGDVADQSIFIAWVGLNDPEGRTIKFQLLYPEKNRRPGPEDAKLWEDFLNNTKEIKPSTEK